MASKAKTMTDAKKLRCLANWFDKMQKAGLFPNNDNDDSREVQADLRRIANKLENYEKLAGYERN